MKIFIKKCTPSKSLIISMFYLLWECYTKKYFQFKGRASRKEFLSFAIVNAVIIILTICLNSLLSSVLVVYAVYSLISLVPAISLLVRRLHDINLSGLWCVALITGIILFHDYLRPNIIISTIFLTIEVFLLYKKGTPGANKYGQSPVD